jgi:sulfane dehydrogenase subunit SoxC
MAMAQGNPVPVEGGDPNILNLPEHAVGLGQGVAVEGYGKPSKFEANLQRRQSPGLTQTTQASVSFAPLQSLFGIVTPSGLHFERHHQGWWDIDPSKHRFMINGMVKKNMVFTMDEIMRLPSVSRFHFIECGANTATEWGNVAVPTVQYTHGMLSCSEFTGVPLITLLELAGADLKNGKFVLAEGGDGSSMTRTIPMSLITSGEVIVAYGQNGEMLRPENGYPLRLVVPGVQGVSWVKYLRRVEVGDKPYAAKDEAIHYIDLQPRWHAPPVHQLAGNQERGDHALGWSGFAGQRFLQHHRPGLVGQRQGQARGRVHRWRTQLASGPAGDAGPVQGLDPFQPGLGVGRQARHHPKPCAR